jgi:hypothetical protein
MPHVAEDVNFILSLYSRCRSNGTLPYSCGILEQPSWLMDLFEVIDNVKAAYKKENEQTQEARAKLEGQ